MKRLPFAGFHVATSRSAFASEGSASCLGCQPVFGVLGAGVVDGALVVLDVVGTTGRSPLMRGMRQPEQHTAPP